MKCPTCGQELNQVEYTEDAEVWVLKVNGVKYFSEYEQDPNNYISVQNGNAVYWGTIEAIEAYLSD